MNAIAVSQNRATLSTEPLSKLDPIVFDAVRSAQKSTFDRLWTAFSARLIAAEEGRKHYENLSVIRRFFADKPPTLIEPLLSNTWVTADEIRKSLGDFAGKSRADATRLTDVLQSLVDKGQIRKRDFADIEHWIGLMKYQVAI